MFRLSYVDRGSNSNLLSDSMRQKSYSSVKLGMVMGRKNLQSDSNNGLLSNKLRTRGASFAKLPAKLKP